MELLLGGDAAEDMGPDFLGSLDLARDLHGPFVRYVAVRALCAHARAIGEVNGLLQLRIQEGLVAVAAGAEGFRVGGFQRGVEAAPEDDAADEAADGEEAEAEVRARAADDLPV